MSTVHTPLDPQYPIVTTRRDETTDKTYFSLSSIIPYNYVPLTITAKVSNDAQLYSDVMLVIYPEQFVTVTYSEGHGTANMFPQAGAYNSNGYGDPPGVDDNDNSNPDIPGVNDGGARPVTNYWGTNYPNGPGTNPNRNFYEVTTTSIGNQMIRIGDQLLPITIGDPARLMPHPYNVMGQYYETDPSLNHVISPKFIMASRRGATSNLNWGTAEERCKRYREPPYRAGTWRVPTFAELALICMMQGDPNSAIKDLLGVDATTWWTAAEGYQITAAQYTSYTSNNGVTYTSTRNVPVRCVHDTWRREQDY